MKKISRILSFLFSALFAVVFAFSAWCGWMLQYSIQNYFTLQEKFSWMGSSPGDWEARFQTWSAVALGYVAPVLFLLLIGSLILAKRSWKSMICHLFFTFAAGFFLILITRFIPVLSLPNRTVSVPFFQTLPFMLKGAVIQSDTMILCRVYPGLMVILLSGPVAAGILWAKSRLGREKAERGEESK